MRVITARHSRSLSIRVDRPLGEHVHGLLDPPCKGVGVSGGGDAVEHGVTIGGVELSESLCGGAVCAERRLDVVGALYGGRPGVDGVPGSVGLWPLHRHQPGHQGDY